jgi:hypothetical protein
MATNPENLLTIALLTPQDDPRDPVCRWGGPVLLWGPPGIGKSGIIEQTGEGLDLSVETLYLSTLQPEDISGIPMPDAKFGARRVCDLPQIQGLYEAGRGILFLDELTTARPAVQGAGLGIVYNRKIAGKHLPPGVRVVGAANKAEDAAGGWNLAAPMANRLLHFDLTAPSPEKWASWLLTGPNEMPISITAGEEMVREQWGSIWPKYQGLGAGFVKSNGAKLYAMPAAGHKDRGRAWASPRSWVSALRCMATAEALDMKEYALDMLTGAVGDGPGAEWAEWVAKANLPDPKDILENGWHPDRSRLDVAFAAYSSAIGWALCKVDKAEQEKYAVMAWDLIAMAIKDRVADIVLPCGASLMRAGYTTKKGGAIAKAAMGPTAHFGETNLANYVRKG